MIGEVRLIQNMRGLDFTIFVPDYLQDVMDNFKTCSFFLHEKSDVWLSIDWQEYKGRLEVPRVGQLLQLFDMMGREKSRHWLRKGE